MSKHLLISGHGMQRNGRFDPGATGIIRKGEHKYVVEDLFPAMRRHLPKNHNVVFFSKHKVSNYGDLVSLVRQYNATQVTEIHYDAATSAARRGHVIIHTDYSPDKVDLALRDAINNMVGVRYTHKGHNGISGRSNLFNVNLARKNNISYRLIELGFGTNPQDAAILTGKVDEYAKELVKAITGTTSDKPVKVTNTPINPSKSSSATKSISTMASEVIDGKHGSGHANRRKSLGISQSEYEKVRAEVNRRAGVTPNPKSKSITTMAREVIDGKHGNGHPNRRNSLGISQAEYNKVRTEVNKLAGSSTKAKKSISQMVNEVIAGKHGNGHANRRKSLGISQAEYNKVRAEVNKKA